MAAVGEFFALVGRTLSELTELSGGAFALLQRDTALLVYALLVGVCLALLVFRRMRRSRAGEGRLVLPAVFGSAMFPKNHAASVRHVAYGLFLLGVIAFAFALADPHTALVEDEASYPGHRITMMIDASLSMNTAFATEQLAAGNTFLANVSAAEYFVKRRMEGPYQDLVSLVQFGNEAYIVTPFTNDYQNILLSISLVGTPEEYRRFPDHGTLIMKAISRGVQLFRSFDFPVRQLQ